MRQFQILQEYFPPNKLFLRFAPIIGQPYINAAES